VIGAKGIQRLKPDNSLIFFDKRQVPVSSKPHGLSPLIKFHSIYMTSTPSVPKYLSRLIFYFNFNHLFY
jgi:hypothetical protein